MKLTIAQALATVLNIKQDGEKYYLLKDGIIIDLSKELHKALESAVTFLDYEETCNFAIFPMGTDRGDFYMRIERELLRQEAQLNGPMWKQFGETDPRALVVSLMDQMRHCASNVVAPPQFQLHMLRVGCLVIPAMQWIDDWIERLTGRLRVLKEKDVPHVDARTAAKIIHGPNGLQLFGPEGIATLQKDSENKYPPMKIEDIPDFIKEEDADTMRHVQAEQAQEENE